jgi:uncharacterized protein DUF4160
LSKIDCFQVDGCVCWFWSHDHLEPHFHAKATGEWEIRVFFGEEPPVYEIVFEAKKIPRKKLYEILRLASEHREALFVEWSQKVKIE